MTLRVVRCSGNERGVASAGTVLLVVASGIEVDWAGLVAALLCFGGHGYDEEVWNAERTERSVKLADSGQKGRKS